MRHTTTPAALALACAVLLGGACTGGDGEPDPELSSLLAALETNDAADLDQTRLEFVGAMELRLDRLHALRTWIEQSGSAPPLAKLEELGDLHARLAEALVELELDDGDGWKAKREAILDDAHRLETGLLELVGSRAG